MSFPPNHNLLSVSRRLTLRGSIQWMTAASCTAVARQQSQLSTRPNFKDFNSTRAGTVCTWHFLVAILFFSGWFGRLAIIFQYYILHAREKFAIIFSKRESNWDYRWLGPLEELYASLLIYTLFFPVSWWMNAGAQNVGGRSQIFSLSVPSKQCFSTHYRRKLGKHMMGSTDGNHSMIDWTHLLMVVIPEGLSSALSQPSCWFEALLLYFASPTAFENQGLFPFCFLIIAGGDKWWK